LGPPVHGKIEQGTLDGNGKANFGPPVASKPIAANGRQILDLLEQILARHPPLSLVNRLDPSMSRFRQFYETQLVLAVIFACAAAPARATDICFRPTASVSGSTVTLKDVANISGGDAAAVARLESTVLCPAPAAGRNSRLDFDEIRSRIEATGVSTATVNFSGAAVVAVSSTQSVVPIVRHTKRKTRTNVSPAQVRRAEKIMSQSVRQSLRTKQRETGNLFLDVVVDPSDVPIILASATEGFDLGHIDPRNTVAQNVEVHSQNSQGQAINFQIQCVVSQKPRVPVLTHSMSAGDVIHEDDLGWKQTESAEGLLMRVEDLVGKEAKKGLHADEPLRADDVRTIPLVRSNDIVTGIWRKGGIRITGQFKSKSDGGKGDVITLVQLTGREKVLARVTDVHEAEIVAADAVRSTKDVDKDQDEQAAPVQTVAHKVKSKRRNSPPVTTAAATVEAGASETGLRTIRGEPADQRTR
jgi:flagellar basal body P-ring formation protein FlgA